MNTSELIGSYLEEYELSLQGEGCPLTILNALALYGMLRGVRVVRPPRFSEEAVSHALRVWDWEGDLQEVHNLWIEGERLGALEKVVFVSGVLNSGTCKNKKAQRLTRAMVKILCASRAPERQSVLQQVGASIQGALLCDLRKDDFLSSALVNHLSDGWAR